jgi:hypothetical protein
VFEPRCYKEDCARADYGGFREALRLGRGLRIAVVGTRGTGKTVYLLALMHELHSGALGPYGASTMMTPHIPAGETWSNRMRILFDRRVLPASTQVVGVPGDLIMDVTGVRDGREKGRLFFRDLAGEEWVRLNAVGPGAEFARIGGFISDADVLFFLLNPLAIEEIGSGLGLGQGEESGAHADILRGATGIFRGRGRIPHLCVILTRADELRDWRQLRPHKDFVFDQNWNHRSPVVEFADMVRCQSDGLRKRLSACPSLREFIGLTENYPTCTYFVVSALGQSTYKAKDKEETMIHDRPRPWRVVDPLVYSSLVLTRTGLLEPTRYDGGEGESGNGVMGDGPPVEKAQEPIVPAALPRREKWQKRRRKR